MKEFNLTHSHVSVIRDALETQIGNLEKRLEENDANFPDDTSLSLGKRIKQDNNRIGEKQRLEDCLKLRREALDVMLVILEAPNRDPVDIHIRR